MKGKKKYIKYGKLSGKIFLNHLSEAECIALGKVFGRSLLPGDFVFSIAQLQAALEETKYCGVEAAAQADFSMENNGGGLLQVNIE